LKRWKNYFTQLINVRRTTDVRQIEIPSTELLAHKPSPFEFDTAIQKLKEYSLTGSDQILAEIIQEGGETL
jgi:hypothetical protein